MNRTTSRPCGSCIPDRRMKAVSTRIRFVVLAGDERVIWQVDTGSNEDRRTDHYVVWSSATPDGTLVTQQSFVGLPGE